MRSDLSWLTGEQMARLQPYFPKSHGRKRVDARWQRGFGSSLQPLEHADKLALLGRGRRSRIRRPWPVGSGRLQRCEHR